MKSNKHDPKQQDLTPSQVKPSDTTGSVEEQDLSPSQVQTSDTIGSLQEDKNAGQSHLFDPLAEDLGMIEFERQKKTILRIYFDRRRWSKNSRFFSMCFKIRNFEFFEFQKLGQNRRQRGCVLTLESGCTLEIYIFLSHKPEIFNLLTGTTDGTVGSNSTT